MYGLDVTALTFCAEVKHLSFLYPLYRIKRCIWRVRYWAESLVSTWITLVHLDDSQHFSLHLLQFHLLSPSLRKYMLPVIRIIKDDQSRHFGNFVQSSMFDLSYRVPPVNFRLGWLLPLTVYIPYIPNREVGNTQKLVVDYNSAEKSKIEGTRYIPEVYTDEF